RPGVSRALDAGVEVSKSSLARLDAIAISSADAWAEEWREAGPAGPPRAGLRGRLAREGLDYLQVYGRGAHAWVLLEQFTPAGMLDVDRADLAGAAPHTLQPAH